MTSQANLQDITATPFDRIRIKHIGHASGNVVDVVNDKIIHGKEQFNIDRFTSLPKEDMSLQPMYQRPVSSLTDNPLYGHQIPSAMVTGSPHPRAFCSAAANNYSSSQMMDSSTNSDYRTQNAANSNSNMPQPTSTINNGSLDSTHNNNNLSMVEQLLSSDSYNDIQDLVSLLGKCCFCYLTPRCYKSIGYQE